MRWRGSDRFTFRRCYGPIRYQQLITRGKSLGCTYNRSETDVVVFLLIKPAPVRGAGFFFTHTSFCGAVELAFNYYLANEVGI
jgi:hypothetical protein